MREGSFHKRGFLLIGFFSGINLLNTFWFQWIFFELTENQIVCIFSSLAQLVGALVGLAISGYSIVDSNYKEMGEKDNTVTDYTNRVREEQFHSLMYIISCSIGAIILSLVVLAIYTYDWPRVIFFFMVETMILFTFTMVEVTRFAYRLNPNTINKYGSYEKEEISQNLSPSQETANESRAPFTTYFELLEQLLGDYAKEFIHESGGKEELSLKAAMDILLRHQILDRQTYSCILELQKYNNALHHSLVGDRGIDLGMFQMLESLYEMIKAMYRQRNNAETTRRNQKELFSYTKKIGIGKVEKQILDMVEEKPMSLQEITKELKKSPATVRNKLHNLTMLGLLRRVQRGREAVWEKM